VGAEALGSAGAGAGSSNDDILRGLGVVGVGTRKDRRGLPSLGAGAADKDVKPVINHEAEYWDQYYAGLESTPVASAPGSSDLGTGADDFGADDDEEDVKPNVEYLDSLNEYRKRARSHEGAEEANKAPKVEQGVANGFGSATGHLNGLAPPADAPMPEVEMAQADEEPKEDPIVYVNGAPMPFSQVTEAEHDLMTPEEYTAFFQIMQDQQM